MKYNALPKIRREFIACFFLVFGIAKLGSGDLWYGLALFSVGIILAF